MSRRDGGDHFHGLAGCRLAEREQPRASRTPRLVSGDAIHMPRDGAEVPFRTSWTADELMATTFPDIK
ncbi:hypothetical protein [Sphaerisporangium corydalis]|uniref:Uncharacterized protein n=1 Tax=Sphaerisporangium corydalis TaxID=1441875 RepID=A0ABV9ET69_9ACTN|nr:hypothetical protein [Sphaerisporangium corydalis]